MLENDLYATVSKPSSEKRQQAPVQVHMPQDDDDNSEDQDQERLLKLQGDTLCLVIGFYCVKFEINCNTFVNAFSLTRLPCRKILGMLQFNRLTG